MRKRKNGSEEVSCSRSKPQSRTPCSPTAQSARTTLKKGGQNGRMQVKNNLNFGTSLKPGNGSLLPATDILKRNCLNKESLQRSISTMEKSGRDIGPGKCKEDKDQNEPALFIG